MIDMRTVPSAGVGHDWMTVHPPLFLVADAPYHLSQRALTLLDNAPKGLLCQV